MRIVLKAVLLKLHAKLAPGWAHIQIKFDPIQEIGPKVWGGRSFVNGPCETTVHTTLENGILHNGQQSGSAVNSFKV